ncbi:ty3-gypsy retrotransposon protein [Cucumis melo var. makuwa]|uniref:Ty3-gypsy retrotransposon protein n=1 Tax=Cucumis melo var. makuwa TaxID=1194695 RepID=A0A5A7TCF9_CUCMM|nr:ty3-gypsy retrotransposon protein [Cucumis melo var. makuwa]
MQEQEKSFVLTKKSWEQLMESPKDRIFIRENPLFDNSTPTFDLLEKESYLELLSIMMADVTAEAAMIEKERKINFLMKVIEDRDHEIATLKDHMKARETIESSKTPAVKADDKGKVMLQESQMQQSIAVNLTVSPRAVGYDHKLHKSSLRRTTTNFPYVLHVIYHENQ